MSAYSNRVDEKYLLSDADRKRLAQLSAKEKSIKQTIGYAYSRINEL
mgnify:CR=1|jgi:hypothetical protein|nr:MAG: hypothetical protein [Bacteriophage sp.]